MRIQIGPVLSVLISAPLAYAQERDTQKDWPVTANRITQETLLADLEAPRHASDGAGRAWIESGPKEVVAGQRGSWTFGFEAGPLGIAEGGTLFFLVSPYWGWSVPQLQSEEWVGFTKVRSDASGIQLRPRVQEQQLLVEVAGRSLLAGEKIWIEYGAGSAQAVVDTYAETGSRFWFAVDGDADGVRKVLADSPSVDVVAAAAAQLHLLLPSTARPGSRVKLSAVLLDAAANAGVRFEGKLRFLTQVQELELAREITWKEEDLGLLVREFDVKEEGVYRLAAQVLSTDDQVLFTAVSNPLLVARRGLPVKWGDLQIHTNLSDGSGSLQQTYRYARDYGRLDVAAITDHDHWGMLFLDQHPALWSAMQEQAAAFYDPGQFVTLLGYEWTNWVHGHRHVLYFQAEGPLYSSMDERYDDPQKLWTALRSHKAITIAHHSAGGPVAVNWKFPPDSEIEPVTEIVSVHGSSEAAQTPRRIYRGLEHNYVRDQLDRGYRLGLLGSSDGHDGHPGFSHLMAPSGGLAAILTEDCSREGVHEALRKRLVYATNGARILLRFSIDGEPMGRVLSVSEDAPESHKLVLWAIGTDQLDRLEFIRNGSVVETHLCKGELEKFWRIEIPRLQPGDYVYMRVQQLNGGAAWTSPVFAE